jgi:type III pantothenate kinase
VPPWQSVGDIMILCLDVGNSQLFAGVFADDTVLFRFRYGTQPSATSDEIGVFLKTVLRENNVTADGITHIAISSVVPSLDYSVRSACIKYFGIEPFILQAGIKTGLNIQYRNPLEVGSDRIANSIAATYLYPNQDIIVVDLGTTTNFCVLSRHKEFKGGLIMPGIRLAAESLQNNTAKLFPVEIIKPQHIIGRSTVENIQAGLYFSQWATIQAVHSRITADVFQGNKPLLLGTGGFSTLFDDGLFDHIETDLILHGLRIALQMNR